jgi:predicted RNase H-like nuclease (RuvC/YqgF family)
LEKLLAEQEAEPKPVEATEFTRRLRDMGHNLYADILEACELIDRLTAENKRIAADYERYTKGQSLNYHDVFCSASRDEPMGCAGCSCEIGRELKHLRAENKELKAIKRTLDLTQLHLRRKNDQIDQLTAENTAKDKEIEGLKTAYDSLHIDFVERGAEIRKLKDEIERLKCNGASFREIEAECG